MPAGLSPKSEDGEKGSSKQSAYERRVARFSVPARFYSHKNQLPSASAVGPAAGAKYSPRLKRVGQGADQNLFSIRTVVSANSLVDAFLVLFLE